MSIQARSTAAYVRRFIAMLAFWLAAVLFVIDVSLLSGWLSSDVAAAQSPAPAPAQSELPRPVAIDPSEDALLQVALDGGATITFPLPPSQSQEVVDFAGENAALILHAATAPDETTYNVGVIEYPLTVDVSDPAVNLIASVSGAAGSAGAQITTQQVTTYQDRPAVEFTLDAPSATVLARNVLVGRRLYAASVAFSGVQPVDARDFLDSLELPN